MKASGHFLVAVCLAALLGAGGAARAQGLAPVQTQQLPGTETNGIRIGDGRMHPFLDEELHYDSAALLAAGTCGKSGVCPEFLLHTRPGLTLQVPSSWVDFSLVGNADVVWYTGLLTRRDTSLTRVDGTANLSAAFNKQGMVEVDVTDTFNRSDLPHDPSLGVGVLSLYNAATVSAPIHPGGGALNVTPHGGVTVEDFSSIVGVSSGTGVVNPAYANYTAFDAGLDGRWRFLPKTAVVLNTDFVDQHYSAAGNLQPLLFTAQAGLAGLITPRIAAVAKAGWGVDFGQSTGSTFIGQLEGTYLLNEITTVRAGVVRTLLPVSTYGTYADTRPYVEGRTLLAGRVTVHGTAAFDLLDFQEPKGTQAARREDNVFSLDVGPQYELAPWCILSAGYILSVRHSNGTSASTSGYQAIVGQILNYTRNEAYVRVTFTY